MVGTIKKTIMGSEGLVPGNTAVDFDMAQAEQRVDEDVGREGSG